MMTIDCFGSQINRMKDRAIRAEVGCYHSQTGEFVFSQQCPDLPKDFNPEEHRHKE
jgi:hypothetical protein